jgi:hypothetical protein
MKYLTTTGMTKLTAILIYDGDLIRIHFSFREESRLKVGRTEGKKRKTERHSRSKGN